jgi:diketogulonate reductase-like aldo/keto reductase
MIKLILLATLLNAVYSKEVVPRLLQNDGSKIPIVGLGTANSGNATYQAIRDAVEAGYRHIDTSLNYGTEKEIGRALHDLISEGKVTREELYIVSKLEEPDHPRERVLRGINESLSNLGLDYLDLYLVHWPRTNIDQAETWAGMEDVQKLGLTKSIGVSNFNESQIDHILVNATIRPVTNQVQCYPYHNQQKLLEYLNEKNITLTAYSPLGRGNESLLTDPTIVSIAANHNVTAAQVILRFQVQRNAIVIPKAVTKKYILENIDIFGFQLNDWELKEILSLNKIV